MKPSHRMLVMSMIVIALSVTLMTTLSDDMRPIGIVFLAIGGTMFVIGMNRKKNEDSTSS